jgi:hypothetical protein
MTNSPAEMVKKQSNKTSDASDAVQPASGENGAFSGTLDRRYHQIGISAVAAAVRYQGAAKNPAYAPVQTNWRHFAEYAAA